jgi:ATP-dependent RNA helicase RhlE
MTEQKKEEITFNGLGIAERLLSSLNKQGFTTPTPIQHQAIPVALQGKDLVGIAQTGTGKTLAFGVPMIQRLAEVKGKGLVLLPTRELAVQVEENLRKFGADFGLRTAVLIGGENINGQFHALKRNPHIIIATPGRMNDHLERGSVRLSDVSVLVLDEADLMFDMGFAPQIEKIIAKTPKTRQTMLFSATMPPEIIKLAERHLSSPLRIEVAPAGKTADGIDQEIIIIKKEDRFGYLDKLMLEYTGSVLVFCRTKRGVHVIARKIKELGHGVAEIHSDRSQAQRQQALNAFKQGKIRILVATDIAARGIDVSNIELVLNYDLPDDTGDYVHRIGRTARAGKTGKAVSLASPDQISEIRQIERLIKKSIPLIKLAQFEEGPIHQSTGRFGRSSRTSYAKPSFGQRRGGSRSQSEPRRDSGRRNGFGSSRQESYSNQGSSYGSERPSFGRPERKRGFAGKGFKKGSRGRSSDEDLLISPEKVLFTDRDRFRAEVVAGREEHYRQFRPARRPNRSSSRFGGRSRGGR